MGRFRRVFPKEEISELGFGLTDTGVEKAPQMEVTCERKLSDRKTWGPHDAPSRSVWLK